MGGSFLTHPQLGDCIAVAIRISLRYWAEEHRGGLDEDEFVMTRLAALYPTIHMKIGKPVFIDVRVVGSPKVLNDTYTYQLRSLDDGHMFLVPCR